MTSSPQPPVTEHPVADPPTDVHVRTRRPVRTVTARVAAAIGAGALVVGVALGMLTGGLVGPGGPGDGGPGGGNGGPPGASTSQDGTTSGT